MQITRNAWNTSSVRLSYDAPPGSEADRLGQTSSMLLADESARKDEEVSRRVTSIRSIRHYGPSFEIWV